MCFTLACTTRMVQSKWSLKGDWLTKVGAAGNGTPAEEQYTIIVPGGPDLNPVYWSADTNPTPEVAEACSLSAAFSTPSAHAREACCRVHECRVRSDMLPPSLEKASKRGF